MRIAKQTTNRTRKGFTLVELLVAAALSILIMFVIATAFQTGLQTLSTLKSLGDMAERLKTAETLLRNDLEAEHFATTGNLPGTAGDESPGAMHVSDLNYHKFNGTNFQLTGSPTLFASTVGPTPQPLAGYFQMFQGLPSFPEGNDADGLLSSSSNGNINHRLSFTSKRTGRTAEQHFAADISSLSNATPGLPPNDERTQVGSQSITDVMAGTQLVSQWAQLDWFLDTSPTGRKTINGVDTWPLMRRVRVLGTRSVTVATPGAGDFLSLNTGNQLNTIQTVAVPGNRTQASAITNAAKLGDDIVVTNVTSFEVRPMYGFPVGPGGVSPGPVDGVFADLPGGPNPTQFDTGLGAVGNNRIRVIAVQIKIRVYDSKNKMSRQTTMVVKL